MGIMGGVGRANTARSIQLKGSTPPNSIFGAVYATAE